MKFWQETYLQLQAGNSVYILTVIENFGSSPGRKGFKMLVSSNGYLFGSVGGGVMEFALVEEAKKLLKQRTSTNFIKKQVHKGNIKDGSGMICSGEQTVAFHYLDNTQIEIVKNILDCLKNGEKGTLSLALDGFSFNTNTINKQFDYQINSSNDWYFKEAIGFKNTLYIIGGGHVGVAVSELFVRLGFYVVVFDNRTNLNTLENNQYAHYKQVIDYTEIKQHLKEEPNTYIAIMTNKYTDDKLVLAQLLDFNSAYIGVLGSKAKLATMWKVFKEEGISDKSLAKIHAPIGMSIKSETPEEIAVSIAAEIINKKNNIL